ncbi:DUF3987 domain-containing protein [Buttiauxella sp. S04-F03]|uniref:DUF3987 domain-containing protein n=1 Tax=Buttiauxella sp. S04-F03 TaxID=2904525 RepID=UPI001E54853E|nr:DUF3987 domain-containing protein [Buttiauxella sp. S04-F03]MCE0815005.1 DUF3987 domain-containing protein [Buttiauxella sp. S04-F03]
MNAAETRPDDIRQAANGENFIAPVVVATGRQRWSKKQGKHVLQKHFSQGDHKTISTIDELSHLLTAHGETLADDSDTGRADLKNRLPFYFGGGLVNGGMPIPGSAYDIPYAATLDAANDAYRRRNVSDVAPCSMITLDIDVMPPALVDKLIGRNGSAAVLDKYRAVFHTTASSTEAAPRARVVIVLAESVTVEQKAVICAQIERQLMREAGAEPTEITGHYVYQGEPVEFDPCVYRDVQVNFMAEADPDKMDIFDGAQLFPEDLPPLSEDDAQRYANAGKKAKRDPSAYNVPDTFTGTAAKLAEWFISIGGETGAKPGLFTLHDHPFKSDETERGYDSSFALQIDENATLSRFQSERNTWRAHCEECKAAGKSSQYMGALALGCPEELAAQVWGGEYLINPVASLDDFECLEPLADELAGLEDYDAAADPFANLADVDIFNPPGLLGEIFRDVERLAHRPLPMASIAAAIQLAATVGGLSGKRSVSGGKLSPLTITLAPSAAGKEQGQSYAKDMLDSLILNDGSCVRFALAKPRSDKEVMRSVLRNAVDVWQDDPSQAARANPSRYGTTLIIGDEADQLFSAMGNRNAATSTAGIGSVLLEVITAKRFSYSGLHREEELNAITTKREALENKLEEAKTALAIWESGEKPKRKIMPQAKAERIVNGGGKALDRLALRETLVIKGVRNPVFAAMLSAVPATFSRFISDAAADSGLLSRALILHAGEGVERLRFDVPEFDKEAPATAAIIRKLTAMLDGADFDDLSVHGGGYTLTEEAQEYRARLLDIFESDEYREHATLGAIYRRALLRIDELATLAGLDTGVIDAAAYEWATQLFNVSAASMRAMIDGNNAGSAGIIATLKMAIVNYLQDPRRHGSAAKSKICEGTTRGKAVRQARQAAKLSGKADPFDVAFDSLLKAGVVGMESRNGGERVTLLKKF